MRLALAVEIAKFFQNLDILVELMPNCCSISNSESLNLKSSIQLVRAMNWGKDAHHQTSCITKQTVEQIATKALVLTTTQAHLLTKSTGANKQTLLSRSPPNNH